MINPIVDIEGHFIVSPNEAEVDHHHDTVWNAKALKRLTETSFFSHFPVKI